MMKRQMKLMLVLLTAGMSQAALGEYNLTTKAGLKQAFDEAMVVSKQGPAQRRQFRVNMGGHNQNPATNFGHAIDAVFAKAQGASGAAAVAKQRTAVKDALAKAKTKSDATIAHLKARVKDGEPDVKSISLDKEVNRLSLNEPQNFQTYIEGIHVAGLVDGLRRSETGKMATAGITDQKYDALFHDDYENKIKADLASIPNLTHEYETVHNRAVDLQGQVTHLTQQKDQAATQRKAAAARIADLTAQATHLTQEVTAGHANAQEARESLAAVTAQVTAARNASRQLRNYLNTKANIANVPADTLEELKKLNKNIRDTVNKLEAQ